LNKPLERVLVLDEGSPGHGVQSRGLARVLAGQWDAELAEYPVRLTLRGLFRPLLRTACALAPRGLSDVWLRLAYQLPTEPPPRAQVIVTSGGRGFCYAVSLARRTGARLVYCGDPAPLPAAWCDVVLSPYTIDGHPRSLATGMLLTDIGPQDIAGRGKSLRATFREGTGSHLAALLIGGDSRSHAYGEEDWSALIQGVNALGEQGWRWLLTTSRRTPPEVEARLRREILADCLIQPVWWHTGPERKVPAFLDAADLVLATRDSLSMLSEGVAAGKPVIALAPRRVLPAPPIDRVLDQAEHARRLRQVALADLASLDYRTEAFEPQVTDIRAELARDTGRLLGIDAAPAGSPTATRARPAPVVPTPPRSLQP
jgi:uncharacterized protein